MHTAPARLRIGFVPYNQGENEYCARMCEILGRLGAVHALPRAHLSGLLAALRRPRRVDVAFVSWYENQMLNAAGQLRLLRAGKVVLKSLLLRAYARKLVFTRHNHVPHATVSADRPLTQHLLDAYEKYLFDGSLTHSPVEAFAGRMYCPHPLYVLEQADQPCALPLSTSDSERVFVVFGRIEPYKQLEPLIRAFPRNARLVICGRCNDDAYLATLKSIAPKHVTIVHGFVPDAAAQELIRRSQGIVISHASDDMVVSASFFYAMTLAQRVFAVETPFLRWASEMLGGDTVVVSANVTQLCQSIASAPPCAAPLTEREALIQKHFGDAAIAHHIERLFDRLELHVRPVESHSEAVPAAVCCNGTLR
ncbi:MAG TPA: hypothetical protein VFN67_08045 [Polyangiales bacterium]|nr:hypothetical protein [Polyangiales bacterium]